MRTGHWVSYKSLSEPCSVRMSLTGRHAIARTNPCIILLGLYLGRGMHHSSDNHLACGDGTILDCCEVMANIGDFGMAIITLDSHYSVLFCQPTPPDVLSVPYGRRADSRGTCTLLGPHLIWEWALRHFGPKILMGLRCENTCHMGSPDLSTSRSRTYP
jgi:hypothetical protein